MTKTSLGRIGFSLDVTTDSYLDDAVEVEKLGYSTLWVAGGQLTSLDPLVRLVEATSTIQVAPGIIPLDVHGPAAVTRLYAALEDSDPGRFLVGLGGPQKGGRGLARLGEFLDVLEAADVPVPVDRRILAALGPRKLELARRRFGGAVTLLVTPGYTAWARERLGPDAALIVDPFVVAEADADRARSAARETVGFLARVPGYAANFTRMGFTDEDISQVSDRLIDGVTVWGDAAAIESGARAHLEAGADQVLIGGGVEIARELAPRLLG